MNHYLAITIGPIFATMQHARKTRELWATSYLYSQLMEYLLEEISTLGGEVLLPQRADNTTRVKFGAGVFNDRLFASIPEDKVAKVDEAIDEAVNKLSNIVASDISNAAPDYWRNFLRIEWAHKSIKDLNDGALFKQFEPVLNAAELHSPYFRSNPHQDHLIDLLKNVYKTKMAQNALSGMAKGQYDGLMKGLFPSTADLATFELFQKKPNEYKELQKSANADERQDEEQMELFYQSLFAKESEFKNLATDYHKYFCIVHADGDNLGALNSKLNDSEAYIKLSKKLSNYALNAAETINQYGGKPVFIGGDDLLFFAPVCSIKDGKTVSVFQLIHELNQQYDLLGLSGTSLSFGLTISYHKYPLFEARQLSYDQMAYRAKKVQWLQLKNGTVEKTSKKNAVAFRLLKHSGAYFEGVLSKAILSKLVETENSLRTGDRDLISGIVYKMETLSGLFEHLSLGNKLATRLGPMFDNFFNEPIHRRNKAQLELIQQLLSEVYHAPFQITGEDNKHHKNLYAILRLLKFITDKAETDTARQNEMSLEPSPLLNPQI